MQNHHFCEDLKYKQMSATFGYTRHSVRDFKQMTPTQVDRHNSSGSNLQLNNSSIIPPTATSRISATNMQTMNSESSPRGSPNSSVSFGTTSSSNPSLINGYNSLNCSLTSSTDSYVNCSSSSAISNVSCCNGDAGNANIDAVSESFNKVLSLASLSPNQSASLTDQPQRRSIVINNDQLIHSPIWMPNTNFNNDNINNNYTKNNNNTNHQPTLTTSVTYSSLQTKALKCFESRSAYVEAMKEDLAEWLNRLYPDLDLTTGNFFSRLETGSIMCRHANYVTNMGRKASKDAKLNDDPAVINKTLSLSTPTNKRHVIDWLKVRILSFKPDAKAGTFFARDNICQFIHWCRSLRILDCLLFETDDLVARKNERSFILCMLEVARIGYAVGVSTPLIIQLEQEIDREIENEAKQEEEEKEKQQQQQQQINQDLQEATISNQTVNKIDDNDEKRNFVQFHDNENAEVDYEYASKPQVITNDLMSLHEKVSSSKCAHDHTYDLISMANRESLHTPALLFITNYSTLFNPLSGRANFVGFNERRLGCRE